MGFTFRKFNDFEDKFNDQLKTYLGKNLKLEVDKVHEPRKQQIQFLQTAINCIKEDLKSTDPNKAEKMKQHFGKVMTGIALIIDAMLPKTSTLMKVMTFGISDGSFLKENLRVAMGHDKENQFTPTDRKNAINAAKGYLSSLIYVNGDHQQGIKDDHPFAHIQCEGFDASVVLDKAVDLIKDAEKCIIGDSKKDQKERLLKKKQEEKNQQGNQGGFLGIFGKKTSHTPVTEISNNNINTLN